MAPKRARAATDANQTPAERQASLLHARLRSRAEGALISSGAPNNLSGMRAPRSLRSADGGDIVKRQAHRRKKYLFVFPGTFSPPPGSTVGRLRGLDSRTPSLDVTYAGYGRLRLSGALVFPRNALLTVKRAAGKTVGVVDTFETLVAFSQWAWLGDEKENLGGVPRKMPEVLKKIVENDLVFAAAGKVSVGADAGGGDRVRKPALAVSADDDEDGEEDVVEFDSDGDVNLRSASQPTAATRVTRRKSVDYSKMFTVDADEEDDASGSGDSNDEEGATAMQANPVRVDLNLSAGRSSQLDKKESDDAVVDVDAPTPKRAKPRKRITKTIELESDESSDEDAVIPDDDGPPPSPRARSKRTAGRAKKNYSDMLDADGDDESGDDSEGNE